MRSSMSSGRGSCFRDATIGAFDLGRSGGRIAQVDDATAAAELFGRLEGQPMSRVQRMFADSKYHNHDLYAHIKENVDGSWELEIVSRSPDAKGWVKLPRRWVVERTFAWLGRYRINSKEYERLASSSESQVYVSSIQFLLRRLKPSKEYKEFKYRCPAA